MKRNSKLPVVDMSIAELMMIFIMLSLWFLAVKKPEPLPKPGPVVIKERNGYKVRVAKNCAEKSVGVDGSSQNLLINIAYGEGEHEVPVTQYDCAQQLCAEIANFLNSEKNGATVDIVGYSSSTPFRRGNDSFFNRHGCKLIGRDRGCNDFISWLRSKNFIEICKKERYWTAAEELKFRQRIIINALGNWTIKRTFRDPKETRRIEIYFNQSP